jgi:Flp pilus assembly protein TadD
VERQVINAVDAGDGDYEIKVLRARLDADPTDLKTRLELADHYRRLGFGEIAIEHGRLACERAPDSEEAHIALAKMLRQDGRSTEGAAMLSDFSAKHNAGAQIWAWLGLLRDDGGDWKAGEAAHRKAIAMEPGHDDLHNNLGYCLLRQGRQNEAIAEFRAALAIDQKSVIARNNLGVALAGSQNEAVLNLQSVADPASAHNNLAVALIEAGKYPEARREIELALSYNRQHSAALKNLALLSQLDGKPAEIKVPVRTEAVHAEGRWARLVTAWRHLWGGEVPAGAKTSNPGDL